MRQRHLRTLATALVALALTTGLTTAASSAASAATGEEPPYTGDVSGDHRPDIVFADEQGNLRLYSSDPYLGSPALLAAEAGQSPDGLGTGWGSALVSHTTGNGIYLDDMWAWQGGGLKLYLNDHGQPGGVDPHGPFFTLGHAGVVTRPQCTGECPGYAADWLAVRQMLGVADVTGDDTPDLITIESDGDAARLWLFSGSAATGVVTSPRLLDTGTAWTGQTLSSPGDTTGDGIPDIWARDTATGTLTQYPVVRDGSGVHLGTPVVIGQGFTEAAFPLVGSDGNIAGGLTDGAPDLWTRSSDGTFRAYAGHRTATGYRFDPPTILGRDFVIEAERLVGVAGEHPLYRADCCGGAWSDGQFLYLAAQQAGVSGSVKVSVEREGDYSIDTVLTAATDYGVMSIALDGHPIGQPFDGYNASGVVNKRTAQGTQHLTAGEHTFTYTITGRNPASKGWAGGIDQILMTRTDTGVNLLSDPGFEAQTARTLGSPWAAAGSAGADLNHPGYPHSGRNNGWAYASSGWNKLTQNVSVEPGRTYRLTGWVETGTTTTQAYFGVNTPDGRVLREVHLPAGVNDYRQYEVTFTAPQSGLVEVFAGSWKTDSDPWVRLDDVTLVPVA